MMEVRYPGISVRMNKRDWDVREERYDMTEEDLRSSSVLKRVRRALREGGVDDKEIEAYTKEATSRCYNHMMFTTMMWVRTS